MRKASEILFIIALLFTALSLTFLIASTVWSFMISAPGYKEELMKQIEEGLIPVDYPGSVSDKADYIQSTFLIIALISLFLFVASMAKIVFCSIAKKKRLTYAYIITIVLGVCTIEPASIVACILGLIANKQNIEDITVSY